MREADGHLDARAGNDCASEFCEGDLGRTIMAGLSETAAQNDVEAGTALLLGHPAPLQVPHGGQLSVPRLGILAWPGLHWRVRRSTIRHWAADARDLAGNARRAVNLQVRELSLVRATSFVEASTELSEKFLWPPAQRPPCYRGWLTRELQAPI